MLSPPVRAARLLDLGRADYRDTWTRQLALAAALQGGAGEETLILVEHPEVVTLGRRLSARDNVLSDAVEVVEVERGGDVTYHGPGQLVGYPILRLDEGERDVHRLLRALEQAVIDACAPLGVVGVRKEGHTGVWVQTPEGERKLASLGVAIRQWVTLHGLALNVSTALDRFALIRPCGLSPGVMTSLAALLGRPVTLDEVKPLLAEALGRALGRRFVP